MYSYHLLEIKRKKKPHKPTLHRYFYKNTAIKLQPFIYHF